jgi:2-hydroxy-3-keto-5-methylthiopentenyl-1-phosphate phosphatase
MQALPPPLNDKKLLIFSDFDGTITEEDAIVMTLKEFAPPEWKGIAHRILVERSLPVQQGIQQLYALVPSSLKNEILEFVQAHVKVRHGFSDFMAWCQVNQLHLQVVSGGLDAFIEPVLVDYAGQYTLFANQANFSATHIQVEMPFAPQSCQVCGTCACCKVEILNRWTSETHYKVVIGDSVTDFGMAKVADWVFARDALAEELHQLGKPFTPFETFHDITEALKRIL